MPVVSCTSVDNVSWGKSPGLFSLSGSVHIWRLQLSASTGHIDDMTALLSADEAVRAKSYLQEKDRQRFVLSRGILRTLLARYLQEPAKDIRFTIGDNKKPYVQAHTATIHYNVSHAGDWVLIAVSDSPVGVDIEQVKTDLDYSEIFPICFSDDEQKAIQSRDDFYLFWTRKESLLKGTGKGIDDDLPFVPCMDGRHEVQAEKIGSETDWAVVSFKTGTQYISSASYDLKIQNVLFYEAKALFE